MYFVYFGNHITTPHFPGNINYYSYYYIDKTCNMYEI
jgi:hypothetical protein